MTNWTILRNPWLQTLIASSLLWTGCADDATDNCPAIRFYSTMELHFSPTKPGYQPREAVFEDIVVDGVPERLVGIALESGASYLMTVDVASPCYGSQTSEILADGSEYQILFRGDGVAGPGVTFADPIVTHSYADADEAGLPIGLANYITVNRPGAGVLSATLLLLPATGQRKLQGLAESLREVERPEFAVAEFEFPLTVE